MGAADDCLTDIVKSLLEDGAEPIIFSFFVCISGCYFNSITFEM